MGETTEICHRTGECVSCLDHCDLLQNSEHSAKRIQELVLMHY
jgi:hypothetical protein